MENAHAETGSPEKRKSKKRRPENLGSLAVVSERAKPAPDRIGHMLMAAESKPDKKESAPLSELLAGRRAETISRHELLELSERVMIDGTSLHQIYETHLVGERGLRRLMAEYQHGGDLKKALRQEIVEREIDFERDPAMRDIAAHQTDSDDADDDSPTTLNKLLEQAGEHADGESEETAFFKARARYEAQELHQHKQRRRVIDFAMAAVILILLALVILLSMSRR